MTKREELWQLTRETIGDGRLSVIMPLYRLASAARENILATDRLYREHGVRAELIPVDDGSEDGTDAILEDLKSDTIKPVVCKRNGGKGAALRAGFAASTGEYVLLLDGDLDIHPKQTPYFFASMVRNKSDIVCGSKRHKRSVVKYPWHRRLVSFVYFSLVRLFVGLPVTDTQTGMKLFKREALGPALARMLVKTYAFDLELLAIAASRGAKISEAPVVIRFGAKFGALNPRTIYSMAMDSLAVFYRLRLLKYYAKAMVPRPLDREPLVSIVIACPKPSWMLEECLKAIDRQTYRNFETIVLPDELTGKVRPAEKRNRGIKAARGEIVAFIDDDAYPDAHWLEYAVKYFSEPDVGALGGPAVTPPDDGGMARLGGRVYENIFVSGNYRYRYKAGGVRKDVDDYPSCNLLVRKDLLDRIGGYRTDFWPGEDTLLCKDIVDAGKRIVYDPWVVVYHHRRPLFRPHLRQLGRYAFHRGYFCKRYPSNSLHLSYFLPTALLAYALLCAPAAWLLGGIALWPLYAYLALVAAGSFAFNPLVWLMTALGVVSTHLWYGFKFAQGCLARKAPCEFIGKDHAHGN